MLALQHRGGAKDETTSRIVVCATEHAQVVGRDVRPSHVVSIGGPGEDLPPVAAEHRLALAFHDIDDRMPGLVAPSADDVDALLAFGRGWSGRNPLLVHCRMGISRSPACAFALACQHRPDLPEDALAARLREVASCATPNRLIASLADDLLGRHGRMRDAVAVIGRGADYVPVGSFLLELPPAPRLPQSGGRGKPSPSWQQACTRGD